MRAKNSHKLFVRYGKLVIAAEGWFAILAVALIFSLFLAAYFRLGLGH